MKRFALILVIISILLSLFGCNSSKTNNNITSDNSKIMPPEVTTPSGSSTAGNEGIPEDASVNTWMSEGFNKVYGAARLPSEKPKSFSLQAAKNERESCHVSIRINQAVKGLTFKQTSADIDNITVEILEEFLIQTGTQYYPDPIVPFDGTFDVEKNTNKSLLIRFAVGKDANAGDYEYKFELADAAGAVVQTFTVNLKVWNITLPDEPTCDTAGAIGKNNISSYERVGMMIVSKKYYKLYYDMLIDYRFSPHDLPYEILDEKADAYMSDPRVTGFRIDHNQSDEKLTQIYEKLKTNPVWLEKAYFYVFDEPTNVEKLNSASQIAARVSKLCPDVDILVAFFTNVKYDDNRDQIDFMSEFLDVYCAKSAAWADKWLADPLGRGYFGDRMDAFNEKGNKIWWYVCWEPGDPYCNLFVNERGVQHRELFWQQYFYNVDGFLYWAVTNWGSVSDPSVESPYNDPPQGREYGDGVLVYPGKNFGVEGPVASLRLECVRDGVEDFDLLKLAEEYLGREWVINKIKLVSESLTVHTKSNETFSSVRKDIGDALEKAIAEAK